METLPCDFTVVGAGVIGCAIASALSQKFKNKTIIVLEAGPRIAEGVTARNSGVIHAGLYYPPTSLKARLCIEGNDLLYEWATKKNVSHTKIGKVVVAKGQKQMDVLEGIFKNAKLSGAKNIKMVGQGELIKLEPNLDMDAALYSPETGIIDQYELTRSFATDAENNGAIFSCSAPVIEISHNGGKYRLKTKDGLIESDVVVNAAGLYCDEVAKLAGIDKYKIYPCRGDYFSFRPQMKFNHLIYPVKEPGAPGLGVHLTVDTGGKYRLGPDTEYVSSKNDFMSSHENKIQKFSEAASKLLGEGAVADLNYDFSGIRPKLRAPDEKDEKDFVISQDKPGFINLIGIESPGLTASIAVAREVVKILV